jgi:hypothetical protein
MSDQNRTGHFWDMIQGRAPLSRSSTLLGFRLIRVAPEEGVLEAEFQAASDFMNTSGFCKAASSLRCWTTRCRIRHCCTWRHRDAADARGD